MKTIQIMGLCVCLMTAACSVAATSTALAQSQSPPAVTATPPFPAPSLPTSFSIDKQVTQLLEDYQRTLNEELAHGDTVMVKNANGGEQKMLNGASKTKIDDLWVNTAYTIDNLKARPAAERQKVIDELEARLSEYTIDFNLDASDSKPVRWSPSLDYVETTRLPEYSQSARVEVYRSLTRKYTVDVASGQIIEIRSAFLLMDPPIPFLTDLTPDQLEEIAREYTVTIGANINFSALTPVFTDQTHSYLFRWEDRHRKQPDGEPHFIQLVYDKGGFLESYINILPLP